MKNTRNLDELRIIAGQRTSEKSYWLDKLSGELEKSGFPCDRPKEGKYKRVLKAVKTRLPQSLSSSLIKLSAGSDVRLHIILTSLFVLLLDKYTGQRDIITGSPILKPEMEADFTNTVTAIRVRVEGGMTFKDLLLQVRQTYGEALKNQAFPIEILIDELGLSFIEGEFPLFDTAIMVENIHARNHLDHVLPPILFHFSRTGEDIDFSIEYDPHLYGDATARKIMDHFERSAAAVMADVDIKVQDVDILSEEEKQQLLYEFNETGAPYPKEKTIQALFEKRVELAPDNAALVGQAQVPAGNNQQGTFTAQVCLTYRELNREAGRLAGILIEKGVGPGMIVGLEVERSIEMIIGILAILKTGAAYLPINPKNPETRTSHMISDCRVRYLLTTRSLQKKISHSQVSELAVESIIIENTGNRSYKPQTSYSAVPAGLAYVIYTSGSTGKPKGVPITHVNFSPLLHWGYRHLKIGQTDRVIQNLSYYFDWSVWEIFITLTTGAALYMIPDEILLSPEAEVDFILRNHITVLHITPTQYRYLVNVGKKMQSLKYLFIGAEKLTYDLAARSLVSVNADCRVFNMYGPTEATIISTVLEIDRKRIYEYKELTGVPIGPAVANTALMILDRHMKLCPIGVTGELYIAGDALAHGYLNNPELTAEKFVAQPGVGAGLPLHSPHQSPLTLYKTGDRCRWLANGTVEFLGRVDFQVKIRGYRIEPGEIENRLLGHPDVRDALVIVKPDENGENYLCAYIVGEPPDVPDTAALRDYLSARLPAYMAPAYFVVLDNMPMNPNGKVNTRALPEPEVGKSAAPYAAPRDEIEKKLARIWADVLGIERPADSAGDEAEGTIGIDDNFFELGGHSLKATKLVYFIRKEFEVEIELKAVFNKPSIRSLAQIVKAAETRAYTAITPAEEKEYYEMSYAQRRLWVLCQFEEDSTAYNMPGAIVLAGPFDTAAFTKTLQTMANRHESLRTVFITVAGDPYQAVIRDFKLDFELIDLRAFDEKTKEEKARRIYLKDADGAFDMERGPLFRFKLVRLEDETHLLIHNFHHIINDGWSQGNIYNEIITLYNTYRAGRENPLPPLEIQYKDYTLWHNDLIRSGRFDAPRDYWVKKLEDRPNGIELPIDHPRKPVQTFNGGRISFMIDNEKTARLSKLGIEEDVTFFMTLLALVSVLLHKYSGQEDIPVGSPIANRRQPELHPIVGFLVNTLVFRSQVSPSTTFKQYLSEIKKETLDCYEYQDYPFDLLVEQLGLDRDLSQSPLFNFMLAHNNAETEAEGMTMDRLTPLPFPHAEDFNMSKFDLIFHMNEFDDYLHPNVEYNSDLFERSAIERMVDNFLVLIDSVLAAPGAPISELNVISETEYEEIVCRFNDSAYDFPEQTVTRMFENRAGQAGDKHAVIYEGEKISYRELNGRANKLAHYLRKTYRIQPNDIIGISMERSIEMIVVLLGIVKSGAAYLAVDPTYPKDRVLHVLTDSRSKILITDKMRPELFGAYPGEILLTDTCGDALSQEPDQNPEAVNRLTDVLYVNYTSGSTGTPNGAMLSHDCLANLILWQNERTTIDCSLRCLQFTSINFCVSFQEIMGALTAGGELYLIGDIERRDIDYLLDYLSAHRIEILFLPFSYLNFLFNESARWDREFDHALKHIVTAGEQLKITSGLKRFLDANPHLHLHNHYGSTEMHVVTSYTLDAAAAGETPIPPAGKPVSNVRIYILDDNLKPVPIGVYGELFVAGRTEILGYINNDALNEEKLIPHPDFSRNGLRLYRSGDSGRWLENGNIELRGRKDYLVKIRGFRVELGEIESKLLSIEQVRECVVVDREDAAGQKYLVAYVVKEGIGIEEINRKLAEDLPLYMIPQIVILDKLPLMPNGKVDRDKLPESERETIATYLPPVNKIEKKLVEIWAGILGIEAGNISVTANFFELGGHSLKATLMVSRIQKRFDRKIPLKEIFKAPTIRELAGNIASARSAEYMDIRAAARKDYYPLSSAQERIFLIYRMEKNSINYNMPTTLALSGALDREKLALTFRQLIDRHESLRTSFHQRDEESFQRIHQPEEIDFEIECFDKGHVSGIIGSFIRPFDLSAPPPVRAGLIPREDGTHILMVDMHHIISDGTSMGVLTSEFMHLYSGQELGPLRIQYKDFSEWQNSAAQKEMIARQEEYWLRQFTGTIPALELPYDFPRPPHKNYEGETLHFEFDEAEAAGLNKIALEQETTLYMVLLSIFYVFLSKIGGGEDIVVGTPTAGRRHADLEPLIGMFINTLCLRNYPGAEKRFDDFLQEVKTRTLEAFENQDYPFEELTDKLGISWEVSRNPLFDVMFVLQNMEIKEINIPGLNLQSYKHETRISKFDLMLMCAEIHGKIAFTLQYSTKLFKKEKIERFAGYIKEITSLILTGTDCKLTDIELSSGLSAPVSDIAQEFEEEFDL